MRVLTMNEEDAAATSTIAPSSRSAFGRGPTGSALSVLNETLDGPRRINGEGERPAVRPAVEETVQMAAALSEVGVAFRAP